MLDMGFLPDMEAILRALPVPRQTIFFSATFSESIKALSQKHQQDPAWVRITPAAQPLEIRQVVYPAEQEQKFEALRWVLEQHPHESALVFANLKITVAKIEQILAKHEVSVASLHGDLEQFDRDRVMAKFRNASTRVLVATDVAARGIDVQDLDLVVNFDLPAQPEVYVHRIGRTGRAGKTGLAVSLCASSELPKLEVIEQACGVTLERIPRQRSKFVAPVEPQRLDRAASMVTLCISGGRKDKLRPGDVLGALTGEAGGLDGKDIGKIEIHEHFTYVAISSKVSASAEQSLSSGRIKGRKFKVTVVA